METATNSISTSGVKVFITSAYAKMNPEANFKNLAQLDKIKKHSVATTPEEADIILFVEDIRNQEDPYLRKLKRHPLVRKFPKKVYMYNPRDFEWYTLPGLYTCLPKQINNPNFVLGSPYLENINPFITYSSEKEPIYLFSFFGALSSPSRKVIAQLTHPRASIRLSTQSMFDATVRPEQPQMDYAALLSDSKFVLCPRGISSSSIRLFETMKAGRVPVILSDNWIRPIGCDWDKFALFVAENDVASIPALLEREEANWPEKSKAARQAWEELFAPETMFNYFIERLLQLNPQQPVPAWMKYRSTVLFLDYFIHKEYRDRVRPRVYALRGFLKRKRS